MKRCGLQMKKTFIKVFIYVCCIANVCCNENTNNLPLNSTQPSLEDSNGALSTFTTSHFTDSGQQELNRCNDATQEYEERWYQNKVSLSRYLHTLKVLHCPQFEEECNKPTFAFNDFTSLIYDYFCSPNKLVEKCLPVLNSIVNDHSENEDFQVKENNYVMFGQRRVASSFVVVSQINSIAMQWNNITSCLRNIRLTSYELTEPCLQVALYKESSEYHEFKSVEIPTCGLFWCGFDEETVVKYQVSAWTCLPHKCKRNIWIIRATFLVLGVTTTFSNLIVILVLLLYPSMKQRSQSIYKLSLAFADFLMGSIGFPTFIVTFWMSTNDVDSLYRYDDSANTCNNTIGNATLRNVVPFQNVPASPSAYLNCVGFINYFSLLVSVYTLAVSGVDRLIAVYKPLHYKEDIAKAVARKVCVAIWIIVAIFSFLPIALPNMEYFAVLSFFSSMTGRNALTIYVITAAIPLLVMWTVSIATYCLTKKYGQTLKRMTSVDSRSSARRVEHRLAKTLVLMVGAFTFCVLPSFILMAVSIYIPSIYPQQVKSYDLEVDFSYSIAKFVVIVISLCNSLCNFFIYSARNLKFRKAAINMIRSTFKRRSVPMFEDSLSC